MRIVRMFVPCLLATVTGCGGNAGPSLPEVVPVSGTITLDGQPLADALVEFVPTEGTPGAGSAAATDAAGKYELSTRAWASTDAAEGAVPGEYKVRVSVLITPDGKPIARDSEQTPADLGAIEKLAIHYSDVSATVLTARVEPRGSQLNFALLSRQ